MKKDVVTKFERTRTNSEEEDKTIGIKLSMEETNQGIYKNPEGEIQLQHKASSIRHASIFLSEGTNLIWTVIITYKMMIRLQRFHNFGGPSNPWIRPDGEHYKRIVSLSS